MVVARKWIHRSTDQASFLDPGESGRNLPGGGVGGPGGPKNRVRKNWAQIDVDFHSFLSIVSFPPYYSWFFWSYHFFQLVFNNYFQWKPTYIIKLVAFQTNQNVSYSFNNTFPRILELLDGILKQKISGFLFFC